MGTNSQDLIVLDSTPTGNTVAPQRIAAPTDGQSSDATNPVDPFSADVPERKEDRRKALLMHHKRFWTQLVGWGVKIIAAALSIPLLYVFAKSQLASCAGHPLSPISCKLSVTGPFLMPFFLFVLLLGNFVYHVWHYHQWEVAMSNAREFADRKIIAKGWTDVFSIYVRTKRRSYHVVAWGLIAFLYAFAGSAINIGEAVNSTAFSALLWLPLLLNTIAGILLLVLAYLLGSSYLPGDVIVRHTLALIIYAVSNITDPNLARRQAAQEADQFVRTNPWWFYAH